MTVAFDTEPGSAHPLGITTCLDGVNFSLFSQAATEVLLLLFSHATATEPAQIIRLDPFHNKTFHVRQQPARHCGSGPGGVVASPPVHGAWEKYRRTCGYPTVIAKGHSPVSAETLIRRSLFLRSTAGVDGVVPASQAAVHSATGLVGSTHNQQSAPSKNSTPAR